MRRWIRFRAAGIHRVVNGLTIGILATILGAVALGQAQQASLHLSAIAAAGSACLGLLAVRLLIGLALARLTMPVGFVRNTYPELLEQLPTSVPHLVKRAESIRILGGTLIEFAHSWPMLEALAAASAQGLSIEIIMLDPESDVLQRVARERATRSTESAAEVVERLEMECRFSIARLFEYLPQDLVQRSLRLSSAIPLHAYQRYGDVYLFTPYMFARGGSSPSLFLTRSASNEPLCSALDREFQELWENELVRRLDGRYSLDASES